MDTNTALTLLNEVLTDLEKKKLLDVPLNFREDLPLLGPNSPLDSLTFISFLTEIEDRITAINGANTYIVMNEISGFDVGQNKLTAFELATHIVKLTN